MSEPEAHRPDPRARTLWAVGAALASGLAGAAPGALAAITGGGLGAVAALAVGLLLGVTAGVAYGRAAWARRTWRLAPTALELRQGVVVQRAAWIPYHRIQQIDLERGPIERLVGLTQVVVRTAAATTDGTIHGLDPGDASQIRERLIELAGVDDAV